MKRNKNSKNMFDSYVNIWIFWKEKKQQKLRKQKIVMLFSLLSNTL